ncbi:PAS domain S-box protein [Desulfofustis limnaeus]|uniref:histidine kinase n=1 Tax=Desulfofustis limnaeus TaxID=2740163 RepID=A0ABN6M9E2_9BACT|nr:PAS domain S-box protein [Desulfofustis limnaeus]MDX9895368.1 PAS domain S-box protein [Desulfofustis sp.]BDD88386.1 hypothetical protein DPPLL_27510 [Desulfofustis limnaeus]
MNPTQQPPDQGAGARTWSDDGPWQRHLNTILSGMSDGFLLLDNELRIHYFNTAAQRILGKEEQTVLGRRLFEVFPEGRGSVFEKIYQEALAQQQERRIESYFAPHAEWYEVNAIPSDEGLAVFFRSITNRKKAEQALHDSEKRFRSYVEHTPYGLFISDATGRYRQVNQEACRLTGYRESELLTMRLGDILAPESRDIGRGHFQQVQQAGLVRGEVRLVRKDGEARWFSVSAVRVTDDRYLGFIEDIDERKRIREEVLRSRQVLAINHRVATIFLTAPDDQLFHDVLALLLHTFVSPIGLIGYLDEGGDLICPTMTREVWDKCQIPDKSIVFPRECWRGIWGRTLLEGQSVIAEGGMQVPPGHVPLHCVMAVPIVQREQVIGQFILANKEGGYSPDDLALLENIAEQVAPILRAHLDRIRQQELQEELEVVNRQLHKQESLARMAGAVAHNYNNKLMVILGNLEMALAELPAGESLVRSSLEDAQAASVQLSELGRDMLAYLGQPHSFRPCPTIDLAALVSRYAGECRPKLSARVVLEVRVPAEPLPVAVEPDHIRRALDRLVTNALESLNETEGRIEVSVERADPAAMEDGYQIPIDWQPPARNYVCLTVGDSGCGMDQEELEHIFDPFYTKKFIGRGMGLPLTLGIVRQYEGMIKVVSEPGGGSAFTLYLPLAGFEG